MNASSNESPVLTLKQAAAYLKRSERALYNLVHKGKLAHIKHLGRLLFSKEDLDASISASRVPALFTRGNHE